MALVGPEQAAQALRDDRVERLTTPVEDVEEGAGARADPRRLHDQVDEELRPGPEPSPGTVNSREDGSGIQPEALASWSRWSISASGRLRRWPNAVERRATQRSCETGESAARPAPEVDEAAGHGHAAALQRRHRRVAALGEERVVGRGDQRAVLGLQREVVEERLGLAPPAHPLQHGRQLQGAPACRPGRRRRSCRPSRRGWPPRSSGRSRAAVRRRSPRPGRAPAGRTRAGGRRSRPRMRRRGSPARRAVGSGRPGSPASPAGSARRCTSPSPRRPKGGR